MRKMSVAKERKIITTNQGYWDGVADHQNQRIAKWYRGAHSNYGHFDADYAEVTAWAFGAKSRRPTQLLVLRENDR